MLKSILQKRFSVKLPTTVVGNRNLTIFLRIYFQECHEHIRVLSHEAGHVVKKEGGENDLIDRIKKDPYFAPILPKIDHLLDPSTFVGRAPKQVDEFLADEVKPVLENYSGKLDSRAVLQV